MPDRATILAATPKCAGCCEPMLCSFSTEKWECRRSTVTRLTACHAPLSWQMAAALVAPPDRVRFVGAE